MDNYARRQIFAANQERRLRRIISAAKSAQDITAVMGSAPTITDPVAGANSTIQTGQTTAQGLYSSDDTSRVLNLGGLTSIGGRIQTITRVNGARVAGHAHGKAFMTNAAAFDITLRNPTTWIAYVTTPDGLRRRIASADRAQIASGNAEYYKVDFGSRAPRLVEVYSRSLVDNFGGINVANGDSIWLPNLDQINIAWMWDSFGEGSANESTPLFSVRKTCVDFASAALGCNNPVVNAVGSTGVLARSTGGTTYNNYLERVLAGDLDEANIGTQDLVILLGSINDSQTGLGGSTDDAVVKAAWQTLVNEVMQRQPSAYIFCFGQEFGSAAAAGASRTLAYKQGTDDAVNYSPTRPSNRVRFLSGNLFESTPDTGVIGTDNVHPAQEAGSQYIGLRLQQRILQECKTLYNYYLNGL